MNRQDTASANGRQAVPVPFSLQDAVNLSRPPAVHGTDLQGHISPAPRAIGAVTTAEMHCELLQLAKGDPAEMEFSLPSHLIILLPDAMSAGCEWNGDEGGGRSSSLPPNTIIFNPAHGYLRLRARASQASCRVLLLTIAPVVLERLFGDGADTANVKFAQRIGVDDENLRHTLLSFLHETESPGWNSRLYIEALLTLLLSQLVRCAWNLTSPKPTPYRKGGLANWRLKRALELLEGDPSQTPSLPELARQLRLHPSSLCRAFKQSTGLPPHRYLLSRRIDRAKEMMTDRPRTLTDIALACGFSDSSQFSTAFRRMVGTSPREYRRSL
jgi:AraC-like DNA-binding protein